MKKYIIAATLLVGFLKTQAQVIIEKDVNQVLSSPSVLLEFGSQPKGILLPWVTNSAGVTDAVAGTVVYDISDKKVKYLKAGTGWIDMSIDANGAVDTSLQDTPSDAPTAKTVIGDPNTAAPGILVLDSPDKALVLPKVSRPAINIVNPSAGMMAYDTNAKQLAVFNGTVWTFWKASDEIIPTVTTATGRVWMDRNLGASRVATSLTDAQAFGDLYQWGRLTDGHQISTSGTTPTQSTTDVPGNSNFIINNDDWRSTPNNNLWQGVNGINNPCPSGFRLPTRTEFEAEMATWSSQDSDGAFTSPLKLSGAGIRDVQGYIYAIGQTLYWTSSTVGNNADYLESGIAVYSASKAYGMSVRCIKN